MYTTPLHRSMKLALWFTIFSVCILFLRRYHPPCPAVGPCTFLRSLIRHAKVYAITLCVSSYTMLSEVLNNAFKNQAFDDTYLNRSTLLSEHFASVYWFVNSYDTARPCLATAPCSLRFEPHVFHYALFRIPTQTAADLAPPRMKHDRIMS